MKNIKISKIIAAASLIGTLFSLSSGSAFAWNRSYEYRHPHYQKSSGYRNFCSVCKKYQLHNHYCRSAIGSFVIYLPFGHTIIRIGGERYFFCNSKSRRIEKLHCKNSERR